MNNILKESKLKLEASFEEIKRDLNEKFDNVSVVLQDIYSNGASANKPRGGKGKRKVFVPQDSLLSKMLHYNDENYKTIFNIAIVILALW